MSLRKKQWFTSKFYTFQLFHTLINLLEIFNGFNPVVAQSQLCYQTSYYVGTLFFLTFQIIWLHHLAILYSILAEFHIGSLSTTLSR